MGDLFYDIEGDPLIKKSMMKSLVFSKAVWSIYMECIGAPALLQKIGSLKLFGL